jgi:hypothetical protein
MRPGMTLPEWTTLFGAAGAGRSARTFCLLLRRGEPLLLLPSRAGAAAQCLQLYPAQTPLAKFARALAGLAVRVPGCPWPGKVRLPWSDTAPVPKLLNALTAGPAMEFGALLGNPRAPGRRWILLVFENGAPRWVVKVGASPRARELIAAEHAALATIPQNLPGRPTGSRLFTEDAISALAMDFVPGCPPSARGVDRALGQLLGQWLGDTAQLRLADSPVWQSVAQVAPAKAAEIENAFGSAPFHPAIFHGDFAPWNLRVSAGQWTALDWERGAINGLPGWDWFHYLVQTRILVEKRGAPEVLAEVEALFASGDWHAYAKRAGISGRERPLLAGYLLWADEVIRPAEGRETLQTLQTLL